MPFFNEKDGPISKKIHTFGKGPHPQAGFEFEGAAEADRGAV
jgi:hypothetical protein